MVQKFNYPKSEIEFRKIQDEAYAISRDAKEKGTKPAFKGLLEIIASEAVILTAIHKIKSNKGSQTPGADEKRMDKDVLQKPANAIMEDIKTSIMNYKAGKIRRKLIDKPGKEEKRPLGIPNIKDRIIQECVRSVIEPILEGQFFAHSYGFRPQRDTHMALERIKDLAHKTQYKWIIEGDISKFFDNVNHTMLIKKLWGMGIRDRRVLMIIKEMLKAGIMDEIKPNELGTPQGGIISPILANVYLHKLDGWITREWENKKTRHKFSANNNMYASLRKKSNLKPAYLVRYADDWVLLTETKSSAEKWRKRIKNYLHTNLKLTLSEDKTHITNIQKKSINFVGFQYKMIKANTSTGWKSRVSVDEDKLALKFKEVRKEIRKIKFENNKEFVIHRINLINSKIRGLINYYQSANTVYLHMHKVGKGVLRLAHTTLKQRKGIETEWTAANEVANLISVHQNYTTKIPTIDYRGLKIGVTSPMFAKWSMRSLKNQSETPYCEKGREIYQKRSKKKTPLARIDEMFSIGTSKGTAGKFSNTKYNFEFYMNRAYVFNRDRGKCRVCGTPILHSENVEIHHVKPYLPIEEVNKVGVLATVHPNCHDKIHNKEDYSHLDKKVWKKIKDFREKLSINN